jgi:hypothetical protein
MEWWRRGRFQHTGMRREGTCNMDDTMSSISAQIADMHELQRNMLTVLTLLLETNEAQTEMLADILKAASEEPGPSPVAEVLSALVAAVDRLTENQATLMTYVAELPNAIGRQFEICLRAQPTAASEV